MALRGKAVPTAPGTPVRPPGVAGLSPEYIHHRWRTTGHYRHGKCLLSTARGMDCRFLQVQRARCRLCATNAPRWDVRRPCDVVSRVAQAVRKGGGCFTIATFGEHAAPYGAPCQPRNPEYPSRSEPHERSQTNADRRSRRRRSAGALPESEDGSLERPSARVHRCDPRRSRLPVLRHALSPEGRRGPQGSPLSHLSAHASPDRAPAQAAPVIGEFHRYA